MLMRHDLLRPLLAASVALLAAAAPAQELRRAALEADFVAVARHQSQREHESSYELHTLEIVRAVAGASDKAPKAVVVIDYVDGDLDVDDPKVYVLPNVCAEGEGHHVSAARAVSLEDFVVALPEQAPQRAPRAAHADRAPRMRSTMEIESRPWLRKYLKRNGDASCGLG